MDSGPGDRHILEQLAHLVEEHHRPNRLGYSADDERPDWLHHMSKVLVQKPGVHACCDASHSTSQRMDQIGNQEERKLKRAPHIMRYSTFFSQSRANPLPGQVDQPSGPRIDLIRMRTAIINSAACRNYAPEHLFASGHRKRLLFCVGRTLSARHYPACSRGRTMCAPTGFPAGRSPRHSAWITSTVHSGQAPAPQGTAVGLGVKLLYESPRPDRILIMAP